MTALFLIFLAWSAYRSVLSVSSYCTSAGEIAAIMAVLEFPPRLSFNNQVRTCHDINLVCR